MRDDEFSNIGHKDAKFRTTYDLKRFPCLPIIRMICSMVKTQLSERVPHDNTVTTQTELFPFAVFEDVWSTKNTQTTQNATLMEKSIRKYCRTPAFHITTRTKPIASLSKTAGPVCAMSALKKSNEPRPGRGKTAGTKIS